MEERVRELEERLLRMERRLARRQNTGTALLVTALVVGVWSCTRFGTQSVVKAERFELRTSDNQLRGVWETTSAHGSKFEIADDDGTSHARILVSPNGTSDLQLQAGNRQLWLAANKSEVTAASVTMRILGPNDDHLPTMNMMLDSEGSVGFSGANEHGLISLGVNRSGEALAWVRSHGGAAEITVDSSGNPNLVLYKDFGKEPVFSAAAK